MTRECAELLKQAFDRDDADLYGGLSSLLGSSYYLGKHHTLREYNPFSKINVSVIGGAKPYDYSKRLAARKMLERGEKLPPELEKLFWLDSFSNQTDAALDALNDAGISTKHIQRVTNDFRGNVGGRPVAYAEDFYKPTKILTDDLKGSDAILQVGESASRGNIFNARRRFGSRLYRLLSDQGYGNFNQPVEWLGGENWMRVFDPKMYDRIFVPGDRSIWKKYYKEQGGPSLRDVEKEWSGRKRNVYTRGISVSPIFENTEYARHAGSGAKGVLTVGGGSGAGMILGDAERMVGKNRASAFNFLDPNAHNLLDDILSAMRSKHGDKFSLDAYVADSIQDPVDIYYGRKSELPPVDEQIKDLNRNVADRKIFKHDVVPSDRDLGKGLRNLRDILNNDTESPVMKQLLSTEKGRKFIDSVRNRYKGLNLIEKVPQTSLAKAHAGADYSFVLPGSTTSEIMAIKGKKNGGLIYLIPNEANWAPRHFSTNAWFANNSLQPKAAKNMIRVMSKDRAKNLVEAVAEGGFKDWKRAVPISEKAKIAPMINAIKRDVAKARLGRIGSLGIIAAPMAFAGYDYWNRNLRKKDKSLMDRFSEYMRRFV